MKRSFCSLFNTVSVLPGPSNTPYRYAILSLFIILSACNSTPQTVQTVVPGTFTVKVLLTPPAPLPKEDSEKLHIACETWYNSTLRSSAFNGGIVVAKKGNIVFESYNGSAHPRGTDLINDSTSFHIASVSKTFTAMAVLKLWQDGKLNIDDEFSKYFPVFNYPGVTIRTMLDHRSGLPNYVHFMENMGWDQKVFITNEDVLDFMIKHKAQLQTGAPNRGFAYCNTNFALLALLVEKITGKKFGDYMKETFFSPLGMNHTFVYNNSTDSGKVTMSYDYRGRLIPFNFLDMVYGDKNVYSTPRDLLTWDRALTSGILFNEKTLAEAYTPYSNEKRGIKNYGLGWRMNNFPSGKKMIYHNGWWHGNNAAFVRLLEDSATIVVLGNKYNRGIYHARDLANLFGNYFGDGGEEDAEAAKTTEQGIKESPRPVVRRAHLRRRAVSKNTHSRKAVVKKGTGHTARRKKR